MTLKKALKKYHGKYVVMQAQLRDASTNKPKTFKVLKECLNTTVAEKAQDYYIAEGFPGVFIYPCFEHDTVLDPKHVARMFRILQGGDR